ncbi:unnamed protein product [Strongylus vulgaris]|uniref:Major facilitator superfamily (MFS) profile domain-containing protein n=1 Tax=Strongylus vulgaris TaxID=40348 RepID=A0A3P7LLG6_STRVU|nr:unnamed protein product [Strongylus vulgaris]
MISKSSRSTNGSVADANPPPEKISTSKSSSEFKVYISQKGGVLTNIQSFYDIDDAMAGLLQTVFMVFFMFCSPVSGFLGDRYNRKWIMVVGIAIWVAAVFGSTLVPADVCFLILYLQMKWQVFSCHYNNKEHMKFWLFLLLRGIVGVGEASYAVISPSIIADMFTGQNRSRMLMVFYFAIPCGRYASQSISQNNGHSYL